MSPSHTTVIVAVFLWDVAVMVEESVWLQPQLTAADIRSQIVAALLIAHHSGALLSSTRCIFNKTQGFPT